MLLYMWCSLVLSCFICCWCICVRKGGCVIEASGRCSCFTASVYICSLFQPLSFSFFCATKPSIKLASWLFFIYYYSPATRLILPLNWASGCNPYHHSDTGPSSSIRQLLWQGQAEDWSSNRVADWLPGRPSSRGVCGARIILIKWEKISRGCPFAHLPHPASNTHCTATSPSPSKGVAF